MVCSSRSTLPSDNRLLAALPEEVYDYLLPKLTPFTLELGDIIYEPGKRIDYLLFPTTSVIALLYIPANGTIVEMTPTGNEGVVGITLCIGNNMAPNRAVVQAAGDAFKLAMKSVWGECRPANLLQVVLLRYVQALIADIFQTATCRCVHTVKKRLCRWLLLTHDRSPSHQFQMTHEFLANILGVQHEEITMAVRQLQEAGLIHYTRGHITIVDRKSLEAAACECYRVAKTEFDRLLSLISFQ